MVPLNSKGDLIIDLIQKFNAEVILVSKNYLGSINHTLLSIEALKKRDIQISGIVFNGDENKSGEEFILNYSELPCLFRIKKEEVINKSTIIKYSNNLKFDI